jgi:hypothetical protein
VQAVTPEQDHTLLRLVLITLSLSLVHTVDHVVRGDFDPALHPEAYQSMLISVGIYLIAGAGLYGQHRNWVGPKCWLVVGVAGLVFAVVAHWDPAAQQTVAYIYHAYQAPLAGAIAVAIFVALTLALLITSGYAAYLALRR